MAYDENGQWVEDQQQQPDPNAAWNNASNEINKWTSSNNPQGRNINWEAAQNVWNQSGGDLNKVYSQSNTWLNPAQQAQTQQSSSQAWGPQQYEAFRNEWLGQGFGNKANAGALESIASKYGIKIDKGQHAFAPDGSYIGDMLGDVGGANTVQFLRGSAGHATTDKLYGGKSGKAAPKGKTPKITPPGPGNLPPGGGAGGGGGAAPGRDAKWDELYNQLMQRSTQGLNVDPNDPVIRMQTDAFRAEQERARRNDMSNLAEQSGPNANLRGEQRMAAERVGQNVSGLQAQLMGKELTARRDEIAQALQSRQGMLTFEQQQALQLKLAQMDDAIKRMSLSQSDKHFNADLGYRNRALEQNDSQFRDRLGFDYGDRSNYWDAVNRGIM